MSLSLKKAMTLADLNFRGIYLLLDLLRDNPRSAEGHLGRMHAAPEDIAPEIERKKERQEERRQKQMRRRKLRRLRREREEATRTVLEASEAHCIFHGSDAAETKRYYRRLEDMGFRGRLGAQLMRTQKASSRAKQYGYGKYTDYAYRNKEKALAGLAGLLSMQDCTLKWGWGVDASGRCMCQHVLYVDLPNGQVSFHATTRGIGPDYAGKWDGIRGVSEDRILKFCLRLERMQSVPVAVKDIQLAVSA